MNTILIDAHAISVMEVGARHVDGLRRGEQLQLEDAPFGGSGSMTLSVQLMVHGKGSNGSKFWRLHSAMGT